MAELLEKYFNFASILVSWSTGNIHGFFLSMTSGRSLMICFIQNPSASAALHALYVYAHRGKLRVLCFLISNLTRFDGSPWIWPSKLVGKPMDLVVCRR